MKDINKVSFLLICVLLGLLIALSPVIVTGAWYNTSKVMGDLLVAEFIIRTLAIVSGLIVIYNGFRHFFISNN